MAQKRVVVLGIDGLEPKIVKKLLKSNKLPNFKKLPFYSTLKTTNPPQSPVAWASFITGTSPEKHQLFDFVKRKPKNYQLYLPYSQNTKESAFKTKPFWQKTGQIPTKILFLPDTYPVSKINGQMLTGMGTPDLLGTEGSLTLFTTKKPKSKLKRGQLVVIKKGKIIKTQIPGPKYQSLKGVQTASLPLDLKIQKNGIDLTITNQHLSLKTGQFSGWVKLKFKVGLFREVSGIAKFYLRSLKPEIKLYLSPINIDPTQPFYPISYPADYSKKLHEKYGAFSTLGLPHDTWAYQEGILNNNAFLSQADQLLEEREKIVLGELKDFRAGLFVAYLGTTDSIQHMFWGQQKIIDQYYQKMDQILGKIIDLLNLKDTLFVLSDHGFGDFNYEVHLNTWLQENGYLVKNTEKDDGELLSNINWGQTKAYALGFNSLYLNLQGREGQGTVSKKDAPKLTKEIARKLIKLRDNKQIVVKEVKLQKDPELIVGYKKGYRGSWQTAVGATPNKIFKKRTEKWQGDHLFAASEVPGVFFANKKLGLKDPVITDVMPLALKEFKIRFP